MIKTVIKRDGTEQPFDAVKLNKWAEYATKHGGNWSEISLTTFKRLPEVSTTQQIHETMIDVCLDKESLEYSRVASRLELAGVRKNMEYILGATDQDSLKEILSVYEDLGVWDSGVIPPYNPRWETWYNELLGIPFEYWQRKQWSDKYACRIDDQVVETPQLGFLGIALALYGDTEDAREFSMGLAQGKINLPTPALNGCRNGDFDTISCCVISGGDTTDSIGVADHIAYKMTSKKAGIGIQYTTRSKGDKVKGGRVDHLGKWPIFKMTDRSVKCLTQITRGGNATVTVLAIDPEIEEMLLWKSQRVDIETRLDKMDFSFGYNEAFINAVVKDSDWYLFSYGDAPKLHDLFYKADATTYDTAVEAYIQGGGKHIKVRARDVLKRFLTVRQETGRFYDINLTRVNEHTPFKDTIFQSNLCVAPETKVLTRNGYEEIQDLSGEKLDIWNGEDWSSVNVVKTGENQKLLRVVTNSGQELECTPYHKFYVSIRGTGGNTKIKMKRAHELQKGDKLIKFNLPVIEGDKELSNAYANGFYSGDGCLTHQGKRIYLYHEKRNLKEFMGDIFKNWYVQEEYNREYGHSDLLKDKFFVPNESYSVQSRVEWFTGLMDADGCVTRNGQAQSLQLASVNKDFLLDVQMMLQTLGVLCKVIKHNEAGVRKLPKNDGSGELGDYNCQATSRLMLGQTSINKLQELGYKPKRLKITGHKPNRECSQFIKVEAVLDEGRTDDTYCFTESKRGMGMFNGLLTGQCLEIALPTKPYENMFDLYASDISQGETAFCSLSAINVMNTSDAEYERIAELTLGAIDKMIDLAPMMTPAMKRDIDKRRSVGVGIIGLAGRLYRNGMDYTDNPETLDYVSKLSELHYFSLLKASQKLAAESGVSVEGIDEEWLPVDTARHSEGSLDWESLRGKPRKHSVLVANMPTESSSLLSNAPNGLYPVRRKIVNKKSRKGIVQYICEPFVIGVNKTAWDIDNITMAKYYARVQDFTDQAISADYYVTPSKFEGGKVPMSQLIREWVAHAKLGNKTKYYLNTNDYNGGGIQDVKRAEAEAEEDCESCKL